MRLNKEWNKKNFQSKMSVYLTEPKFSSQISKSPHVVLPLAIEILAAVFAPLKHLNHYKYYIKITGEILKIYIIYTYFV